MSETFHVLKEKEICQFSEPRTRRLILEAWKKLKSEELHSHGGASEGVDLCL